MRIRLVSDDIPPMEYNINPHNVIGAYEAQELLDDGTMKGAGEYYIDLASGRDFRVSEESYYSILAWICMNEWMDK